MSKNEILKILSRENIRFIDGRYSNGFVDTEKLQELVDAGDVEFYENKGVRFCRKHIAPNVTPKAGTRA